MIDAKKLGKIIAEDIAKDRGICFYPGSFKPPHKGHFQAVKDLTARPHIIKVVILISNKEIDGISPEDSMQVWLKYFKAAPNPKVDLRIVTEESPVKTIFSYMEKEKDIKTLYVAGGKEEQDDQNYLTSLQNEFEGAVAAIPVSEQVGNVTDELVRQALAERNYEAFKEALPVVVYNKGYADEIYKFLIKDMEQNKPADDTKGT